jgi:hypothetical protein
MRKFTRRWAPHDLAASRKAKRAVDMRMVLQALRNEQSQNWSYIMTGDDRWFYDNSDSPTIFARARDEVVPRVSRTIGSKKVMVIIFFTVNRLLKRAYLSQGQKYNKEYFVNEILEGISQECNQGIGYRVTKTLTIEMDNSQGHDAWKDCRQLVE